MKLGPMGRQFLRLVEAHALRYRLPTLMPYIALAMHDRLTEGMARQVLNSRRFREAVRRAEASPNHTFRPPTADELYADGPPDITIGSITEGDRLRIGIDLRPKHALLAGSTGSGKTTAVRAMILAIDRRNHGQ